MQNDNKKTAGRRPFPPKGRADKIDAIIGEKIRARRERIGFSQPQLGDAIGVTFQQVQKYERGFNRVSASKLFRIADALGEDVGHFYDGLLGAAPTSGGGPQKKNSAMTPEKKSRLRPDPETEDMLALFQGITSAKHRRQLLELARSFVEASPGKKQTGT
jgi:transcriptional regulator with XRE-family HTH domain